MTRQKAAATLRTVKIIFIILGVVLIGIGFHKHLSYNNPNGDSYSYNDDEDEVNAYVGGDAYNYIINGTYFTAYSVLGAGAFIIATIAGVGAVFLSVDEKTNVNTEKKQIGVIEDIESNLPRM